MPVAALLQRPLQRGFVQCTACEHWCAVAPGAAGRCGVRYNDGGKLYLAVYGRAVAAQIDPVEKKPLHHFLPHQSVFSIGTLGCNFSCHWCQNWQISQYRNLNLVADEIGQPLLPEEIVDLCVRRTVPMVAFTYNEPAVFFEYAFDTAKLARQAGLRTVLVSNGFETQSALDRLTPHLDAVNIDLKAMRDETYRTYCGARLAPILRNLEQLAHATGVWLEVTTLVIPDLNDNPAELKQIAAFLADLSPDIPWHISAFTPQYQMFDRPHTSLDTLRQAWEIGFEAGLRYVYCGNIWRSPSLRGCADTRCPTCSKTLVRRSGYHVRQYWHEPGVCPACRTELAGVWTTRNRPVRPPTAGIKNADRS